MTLHIKNRRNRLAYKGEYGSRLHSERVKHALERGLEHSKAKNTDLVGKMIDLSLVTSDEDGVYGLDEQIENLEKTAPYLFGEEEKEKPKLFSTGMTHGEAKSDPDKLDDYEYYKKHRNQELVEWAEAHSLGP